MDAGLGKATDAVFEFLKEPIKGPVPAFLDNGGMWFNVRNEVLSKNNRHYEIWQLYVRECYLKKLINVFKITDGQQLGDILTKPIPVEDEKFIRVRKALLNL